MKKILYFVCLLSPFTLSSQNNLHCGFLEAQEYLYSTDATAKQRFNNLLLAAKEQSQPFSKPSAVPIYTIPVVFHVLHTGGSENISDAQIQDAMAILNRDFNKKNPDTANIVASFQNIAADCNIAFELATLDEQGNCTTGITRHYDNNTNWVVNASNYIYTWNRTMYLNIYIVKSMANGVAGYTYLPGTAGPNMDAIVILSSYVGSIGTGFPGGSRSLTHEVGHWLNLQHVWGSTNQPGINCGDDGVGDTPVTKGHGWCSLSNAIDCTPNVEENIQNYMEYAFCSVMYTQGQRTRIHNALNSATAGRNNIWSQTNLSATGIINPSIGCAPKAEYKGDADVTCVGNPTSFTDLSYNGTVSNWEWTSASASNVSTVQNGLLTFANTGPATVKLKVSNSFGEDSISKQTIMVMAAGNSGTVNLVQGFESGLFPDAVWLRSLPKYGSSFETTTISANSGSNCVWINNFYDNPSEKVNLYSPAFNFQSFSPAILTFYYAYAQISSNNNDALIVYATKDCGANWIPVFSRSGSSLSTTGVTSLTPFTATASDFAIVNVVLTQFANENMYLKFEFTPNVSGSGNNLFLDDINISGLVGISENSKTIHPSVFPNPFTDEINLRGVNRSTLLEVELYDVYAKKLQINKEFETSNELKLKTSKELARGIYFLKVQTSEGSGVVKIIKD